MKVLYLIDSENVGDFWIPLLDLPDDETELVVFYTKNSPHMSYDSLIKLKLSDKLVTFIKCFEGTNALDFQLVSELGYRMRDNEEGEFVIVTNDTGYDAAVKYWRKKGFSVRRITGKECRNAGRSRRQRERSVPEKPAAEAVRLEEPVAEETASKEPVSEETAAKEPVSAGPVSEEPSPKEAVSKEPVSDKVQEADAPQAVPEPVSEDFEKPQAQTEDVQPVSAAPVEETNRSAPVAEKKVWNGTGFSTVTPVAPAVKEEAKPLPSEETESAPAQTAEVSKEVSAAEPETVKEPQPQKKELPAEARAVATVKPAKKNKPEGRKTKEKKPEPDTAIVVDSNGISSGEAELKDLTVIVSCVGMDNLAELHNQLIQFYGEGGKQIYQSIKNGSMQIEKADWSQHEKYAKYGELIFRHHGDGEKCPEDFADFIESAGKKRDNLNSFRYALLKRYGKEKGRKYYFLLKPFVKAINEM